VPVTATPYAFESAVAEPKATTIATTATNSITLIAGT